MSSADAERFSLLELLSSLSMLMLTLLPPVLPSCPLRLRVRVDTGRAPALAGLLSKERSAVTKSSSPVKEYGSWTVWPCPGTVRLQLPPPPPLLLIPLPPDRQETPPLLLVLPPALLVLKPAPPPLTPPLSPTLLPPLLPLLLPELTHLPPQPLPPSLLMQQHGPPPDAMHALPKRGARTDSWSNMRPNMGL